MGYAAHRGDPKFSSVQSFRTVDNIYIRIVTRVSHGWDPITDISYKNTILKEYEQSLDITTTSDFKVFLYTFNSEVSSVLNSTSFDAEYFSKSKSTLTGYFDIPQLDLGISDLVFEDKLGGGDIDNLYSYNSTIYHSSSTLKNTLRTFIYPAKTKGPDTLAPKNTAGRYYVSNSSTVLYVANSGLQNSYYKSISDQTSNQNMYGYFVGGVASQSMHFECSMGAKSGNINLIKGDVHLINAVEVLATSTTYEVCTTRNSSNYYRASPYPTCNDGNLSADIVNDSSNIFIDGGCCETTPAKNSFKINHTIEIPPTNDLDGGSILYRWEGGTPPYNVSLTCATGDTGCAATIGAVNTSLNSTTDTAYTLTGLSGSSSEGDLYGFTVVDANSDSVGGQAYMPTASSRMPPSWCNLVGAINYTSSSPAQSVLNNTKCRWCSAGSGGVTMGVEDSDDSSDPSTVEAFAMTFNDYGVAPTTTGDVNISIGVDVQGHINGSEHFFEGTGTERLRVKMGILTVADYTSGNDLPTLWAISDAAQGSPVLVSHTSVAEGDFEFHDVAPGYYIFKSYYYDSAGTTLDECASYTLRTVTAYGCTDSAALNTSTGPSVPVDYGSSTGNTTALVISDNTLCTYDTVAVSSAFQAAFDLTIGNQTDGNNPCSFEANLNYNGNDFNLALIYATVISAVSGAINIPASSVSVAYSFATIVYSSFEGEVFTGEATTDFMAMPGETFNGSQLINFNTDPSTVFTPVGISSASMTMAVMIGSTPINQTLTWSADLVSLAAITNENIVDATGDILCNGCFNASDYTLGCTDSTACNYSSLATVDNGTCFPMEVVASGSGTEVTVVMPDGAVITGNPCGCTDSNYMVYDPLALWAAITYNGGDPYVDNAYCGPFIVAGCMDSTYVEFNPQANEHVPGDCVTPVLVGCTDTHACNYNPAALQMCDDSCCIFTPLNCGAINNWSIASYNAPNTCNEEETQDGVITFVNADYSGPLAIMAYAVSGTVFNVWNASTPLAMLSGVNAAGVYSFTPSPGMLAAGVTMEVFQHNSLGTTVTFSGLISSIVQIYFTVPTAGMTSFSDFSLANECLCMFNAPDTLTSGFDYLTNAASVYTITAIGGTRANGSTGICGCMDEMSGTYEPTAEVHTPALCEYHGCNDPLATNYLPGATAICDDPNSQTYGGYPCSPCVYGVGSNLYSPAFCMPSNVSQQLEVIKKCIGTAGTNSYINTITGKDDCTFKEAWKLILIEYLLSKKGLDCVYNCADGATPKLSTLKTCEEKVTHGAGQYVGTLASPLTTADADFYRSFWVGDVIRMRRSSLQPVYYYELIKYPEIYLPNGDLASTLTIHHSDYYTNLGTSDLSVMYSPLSSTGHAYWKMCEEPPSKPSSKDYLGKFITFVQNYCRECQLPSSKIVSEDNTTPIESVITVNGIILTINNSELK